MPVYLVRSSVTELVADLEGVDLSLPLGERLTPSLTELPICDYGTIVCYGDTIATLSLQTRLAKTTVTPAAWKKNTDTQNFT